MSCQMYIVKSDYGEVVRYAKARVEGGMHNADCSHVVGTHDGSRRVVEALELLKSNLAALNGVIAFDDKVRRNLDAYCRRRFLECLFAGARGVKASRA